MQSIFKSSSAVIGQIEEFLTIVDESSLVFVEGIRNYLKGNREEFVNAMQKADEMEGKADALRRSVEDALYRHSLMPEFRGDILHLLEKLDDLIDIAKENLLQFDVESPDIPPEVHEDFIDLAKTSIKAVEAIVLSVRTFFRDPRSVKDLLPKVYFYEEEADRASNALKRRIYKEIPDLDLSRKNHIRYFIHQAENLSDVSEAIADIVAILAIKRTN
ncbi:MAG: DUF47 family protein [Bacteroidales bacterium]|nr:DUF47 family protein [Bacteroidales bacterium]